MQTRFEYEFYIHTDKGTTTDTVEGTSGAVAQSIMESRYPGVRVQLKSMNKIEERD
jgi:hypothetical protein